MTSRFVFSVSSCVQLLLCLGCPGRTTVDTTLPSGEAHVVAVDGLELRILPRDTQGLVHVSLFVDAGSRDADPVSAGTIAAWLAAPDGIEARATPDFIEFRTGIEVDELNATLTALAEVLRRRDIAPDEHAQLVGMWEQAQRESRSVPARRADALALQSLLGEGADPFSGEPASREDVADFLRAHFGPTRALLVVLGDVEADVVESAARATFRNLPAANELRPNATPSPDESVVESGTQTRATIAVEMGLYRDALALGQRTLDTGLAESVSVYPHASGTALLLRTKRSERILPLHWMSRHAWGFDPVEPPSESPSREAERIGLAWRRGEIRQRERESRIGIVCREGAECVAPEERELPDVEVAGSTARSVLPNGAEVVAIKRRSRDVAWAVHLNSGGEGHGEVVVLAHSLARKCDSSVRLDTFGFALVGRGGRWRRDVRRALDCMTREIGSVRRDWTRTLDRLRQNPERGWIAGVLSPGLSGRVAPEGRLHEVAGAADAARRWSSLRVGARTRVVIAGNIDPERAVRTVPVVGVWPRGDAATTARWGEVVPIAPADWSEAARVVVGWRTDEGSAGAGVAARAFARAAAEHWSEHGAVLWHDGDGGAWGAWAAVALDVTPEVVDGLGAIGGHRFEVDWEPQLERERWRGGNVEEVAWRVSSGQAADIPTPVDPTGVVTRLRRSSPSFAIGRPQNADALRRWQRSHP